MCLMGREKRQDELRIPLAGAQQGKGRWAGVLREGTSSFLRAFLPEEGSAR